MAQVDGDGSHFQVDNIGKGAYGRARYGKKSGPQMVRILCGAGSARVTRGEGVQDMQRGI